MQLHSTQNHPRKQIHSPHPIGSTKASPTSTLLLADVSPGQGLSGLRYLRLLALCCGLCCAVLGIPQAAWAKTAIQTGATPTTAFLQLGEQILIDQPGFHLSKPQWSPDGRWLAVTTVPSGAGTALLAETVLFDANTGAQLVRLAGHTPTWSSDSRLLSLQNSEGTGAYDITERRFIQETLTPRRSDDAFILTAPQLPLAYPQTIRVAHHPSNGCRNLPDWQVDVIPFEEYVAQVVPAEVPASWPAAALEAMAVAARSYAWRQILAGRSTYDVTDWANFQMMCADRYSSTDAAVSATAGQYLTAKNESPGVPISAMYSAENGHPTLTNTNVTYLQAVPDLFALGRERYGHGYGLSQWGAYRRARAGQTYRQILGHYYSAVYLQNGMTATQPAALLGLLPQSGLATDALRLTTLGPATWFPRLVITATAGLATSVSFAESEALWRAAQPLPENSVITAQVWHADQLADQVILRVDHTAPAAPILPMVTVVTQPLLTITVPSVADVTPLLNTKWAWAGEALLHTANSGAVFADVQAPDGTAWGARVGVQQKGVWYGPRTTVLPAGYNYRALFWLRVGTASSAAVAANAVARLDVTDDEGREILGLRDLWSSDFPNTTQYWPLAVDFHLFHAPVGLEFRVAWPGVVDLALDRVEIWRLPSTSTATNDQFTLPFYGQQGSFALEAAQMDSAGNLSETTTRTLTLVDSDAPQLGAWSLPTGWLMTNTITVTVPVTDSFSGLADSQFRVVGQTYALTLPVNLPMDKLPWQGQMLTAQFKAVPDGEHTLTLSAFDYAGNRRQQSRALRIDTIPPTVTVQMGATPVAGWYGAPVLLKLMATDDTSGVAALDYKVTAAASSTPLAQRTVPSYTQAISLTTSGVQQITYTASDQAGNMAASQALTVALDLAAPVVRLQQLSFYTETVQIAWQIQDEGIGVDQIEMQMQQGEAAWQTAPWDYTTQTTAQLLLDPEVTTKVRARAQDRFGHQSEWVTITLWRAAAWSYLPVVHR